MNQRKTGAVLSYVSIGFGNLIGLLYTPFLLRMMGQSEYGLFALATSLIAYLSVLDFGFGNASVRYMALYRSKNKKKEQSSLLGLLLSLYSVIALFTFVGGVLLSVYADRFFSNTMTVDELGKIRVLILLLTFNVAISFPLSVFESVIIAYERFAFQKILQIARVLLQPLIMIPLLLAGHKSVSLVVLITVLNLIYLLCNCWYFFQKIKIKISFSHFDLSLLKEIIEYSFWVFLGMVVDRLYWSTGQVVLGAVAGASAIAVYAVAIQFKNYFSSFSTAISSVFLPTLTAMDSKEEISDLFIKIGRIQFVIISFVLSGFILLGKSFVRLWAGAEYNDSYAIALVLMVPLSIPLIQTLGISILQAKNKLKFRSCLYLVIAVCCCMLSIPLAKKYEGIGCAIGIAIPLIVGNILIMNVYYYKAIHLNVPRFWKEIFRMFVPVSLITLIVYCLLYYLNLEISWTNFICQAILFSFVYFFTVFRWGLNQYERDLFLASVKKISKCVKI